MREKQDKQRIAGQGRIRVRVTGIGDCRFAALVVVVPAILGCGPSRNAWRVDHNAWRVDDDATADAVSLVMPFAIYLRDRHGNERFNPLSIGFAVTALPLPGAPMTGSGNNKEIGPDGRTRVRRGLWGIFLADDSQLGALNVYGEQLIFAHADAPWGVGFVLGAAGFFWRTESDEVNEEFGLYCGGLLERQTGDRGFVFRAELSAIVSVEGTVVLYPSVGFLWLE